MWRILRQNCSDDSTEVTEGVTSTPEIFGNKHSFVLTFFATNTIYVNYNRCKSSKLKNYTARQNRKRVNYDQSLLDDRHHGFELSRSADRHRLTATSCIPHDSVYMPGARAGTPNISNICEAEVTLTPLISKICKPCFQSSSLQPWHFRGIFVFCF